MQNYAKPKKSQFGKYLFCYFTGNEPERERICFALSDDGYNFTPINGGNPVIIQKKGTKCMRDPFILRNENGGYYIIATDMKSSLGWDSNHGIVTWRSDDLINWYDETAVDFHIFDSTKNADKIWAPEAIYDKEEGKYFVYYSVHNNGSDKALSIWYSYTDDFKSFTEPAELFAPKSGKDAIDADIVEFNGKYYMCYKDECEKTICQVVADKLTGPYRECENNTVACTDHHVEGNCMYRINGTDAFVMVMDMYCDNQYFMQQTEDFKTYLPINEKDYSLAFTPRHASVLQISDEEYSRLVNHFGK